MKLLSCKVIFFVVFLFLIKANEAFSSNNFDLNTNELDTTPIHHNEYIIEQYFDQIFDHTDINNNKLWKQRYFTNKKHFISKNGPVFLLIGGEYEISLEKAQEGIWIDYSRKFNALFFHLEHRFFGKSYPTSNMNITNLRYLTTFQAINDLAVFITGMNKKYNLAENTKWIVFGNSYSGTLAAWLKHIHPNIIHGAVSESAAVLSTLDFQDYAATVGHVLKTESKNCVVAIKKAFEQLDSLFTTTRGRDEIRKKFRICSSHTQFGETTMDVSSFYRIVAGIIFITVQNNNVVRLNLNVNNICEIMNNETLGSEVGRLAEMTNEEFFSIKCLDTSYKFLDNDKINDQQSGSRPWYYLKCNDFGFFLTSSYRPQIFGDKFPIDYFVNICATTFGSRFTKDYMKQAVVKTNKLYGGMNLNLTNVVFIQNSFDPWHGLGITKKLNQDTEIIFLKGTAHCAVTGATAEYITPAIEEARKKIENIINTWLEQ